ncbi:ras-related protein Rab-5A-like [Oppia nitens]|uniref:ras-related protein Rab-5A-like n=1 Tax=Oppia nitens TaxID=1686743 RepID=UPI0023DA7294|nr:ras-related protein Rab-5A-like [Oppia nitens]
MATNHNNVKHIDNDNNDEKTIDRELEFKNRIKYKEYRFKLVIVGTFGVGKTSLMIQHFDRQFTADPKTTVGVDFRQRKFHLNSASVILEVWDTAGEEKYSNIVQIYYRGAHAVVAVYDIRKRSTYTRALQYIKEINNQAVPPLVIVLVGNKQDLSSEREVDYESTLKYASARNLIFMETSAKCNSNVDQLFESVAERLVEECVRRKYESDLRKKLQLESHSIRQSSTPAIDRRNSCCSTS